LKPEDRPEELIKVYIKELEAGARGGMVIISSKKVIRRFKVESPNLKAQITRLLPRIAERYGYVATRIGRRRVYVKMLKAPLTIKGGGRSRRLRLTLHQYGKGPIPQLSKGDEGGNYIGKEYETASPYGFNAPPFTSPLERRVKEE